MFIHHNTAHLYTVEFGSGPQTIIAHGGWTGSWELWAGPFHSLSKTWRTIAYDHRGTGATIAPVESISIEAMVDDLFTVMDHMDVEKCVLAAESAGGIVAVTAVLQQPERFSGLVLVDALLHNKDDNSDAAFIQGLKTNFHGTIGGFTDACVLETEVNSPEIRSWGRKILARATPESAVRLLECTHGIDLRPQLSQIRISTLIIHGDEDVIVPPSDSEFMASQVQNSQLHIINGVGHVPTMTCPDKVAQLIDQAFSN
jgi:pimeloyl-ACP methyl ester carboxylesterase